MRGHMIRLLPPPATTIAGDAAGELDGGYTASVGTADGRAVMDVSVRRRNDEQVVGQAVDSEPSIDPQRAEYPASERIRKIIFAAARNFFRTATEKLVGQPCRFGPRTHERFRSDLCPACNQARLLDVVVRDRRPQTALATSSSWPAPGRNVE